MPINYHGPLCKVLRESRNKKEGLKVILTKKRRKSINREHCKELYIWIGKGNSDHHEEQYLYFENPLIIGCYIRRFIRKMSHYHRPQAATRLSFATSLMSQRLGCLVLFIFAHIVHVSGNPLKVGILASKGKDEAVLLWNKTFTEALSNLTGETFSVSYYGYQEMLEPIENGELDLVLGNPFIQTCANAIASAAPIATLQKVYDGVTLSEYAGVFLALASNTEVNVIEDVKDKVIALASLKSFGGAQAQFHAMIDSEAHPFLSPTQLKVTHSQFKVVEELINGTADIGLLRMDTLASMVRKGLLADISDFKILSPIAATNDFPYVRSTELYNEWALLAFPHVPEETQEKLIEGLFKLNLSATSESLQKGGYLKFSAAKSYFDVANIERQLGILHTDVTTNSETCRISDNDLDTLICPDGYAKYADDIVAEHCAELAASNSKYACPDEYECICTPCRKSLPVEVYPLDSSYYRAVVNNANLSTEDFLISLEDPCSRVKVCGSWTEDDDTLTFLLVDHVVEDRTSDFDPQWTLHSDSESISGNATMISDDKKYWIIEIPGQDIASFVLELFDVTTSLDVSPVVINVDERLDTGDVGHFISTIVQILGGATLALSVLAALIFLIFRKSPIVKSNRLDVLLLQCAGCIMMGYSSVLVVTLATPLAEIPEDRHHLSATGETAVCYLEVAFPMLALHLTMTTFFVKSIFLVRLYKYMAMKRVKFTSRGLLKKLLLLSLPDIIISVAMLAITRPHVKNYLQRFCLSSTDIGVRPFMLALTTIKIPPLVYAGWGAWQTESLPKRFNNSRLQWIIVTIGVLYTAISFLIWGALDESVTATTKNKVGVFMLTVAQCVCVPNFIVSPAWSTLKSVHHRRPVRSVLRSVLSLSNSSGPSVIINGSVSGDATVAPSGLNIKVGDDEKSESFQNKEAQQLTIDQLLDRLVEAAQKKGNEVDQLKKTLETESGKLNKLRDKVFTLRREMDVRNQSSLAAFAFKGKLVSSYRPRGSSVLGGKRNSSVGSPVHSPGSVGSVASIDEIK